MAAAQDSRSAAPGGGAGRAAPVTCPFGQSLSHHLARRWICLSGEANSYL